MVSADRLNTINRDRVQRINTLIDAHRETRRQLQAKGEAMNEQDRLRCAGLLQLIQYLIAERDSLHYH